MGFELEILVFFLSIGVHEFGHYVAFTLFGFKPKFYRRGVNFSVGDELVYKLSLGQFVIISIWGILFGVVFILTVDDFFPLDLYMLGLVYILLCIGDINNLNEVTCCLDNLKMNMGDFRRAEIDKELKMIYEQREGAKPE